MLLTGAFARLCYGEYALVSVVEFAFLFNEIIINKIFSFSLAPWRCSGTLRRLQYGPARIFLVPFVAPRPASIILIRSP